MATAVGTSFDISKLGKELDKLDKQLDAIVKKGDKAKHAIEQMLLGGNANNFLNKIEKIKKSVIDLSSIKDPMKWDSSKLKGYIDQVNRLIRTVNQINTVNGGGKQLIDTTNLGEAKKELSSLLKEVKSLEKSQSERRTSRNQTYSGALKYSSNVKNLEQERQAIINLEAARDKLKKTDSDYANKLNTLNEAIQRHERNLKDSAKTDQQRAAEAKKASDKIIEAQRREREEYEKRKKSTMDKWYSSNSERALKFSSNAKTLEDEARAIKYLEAARAKLNTQDKNYERNLATLNSRIREHKINLDAAKRGAQELQDKHKGLMNTGEQLKRALIGVFSVSAIKVYINKLREVRGEFEMQQRSLQILLQNKNKADELWEKTIDLAVKSPFRVKELVTYTKQLAAYRVESDKLYDTTKMLADVSAGLGVDMNRLILAFGQVKAANFLRGTELRQFTEAGIPMLDELAKLFTELEGRAVSAGDVFERISKRMVTFGDVEEVFNRITSAGGVFYNMQEEQSKTLAGLYSNLHDSIDLMLNDIGKANDGLLKGSINVAKEFVENWREVAYVLAQIVAGLTAYKLSSAAFALGLENTTNATLRYNNAMTWAEAKAIGYTKSQFALTKALTATKIAANGVKVAFMQIMLPALLIGGIAKLVQMMTKASREANRLKKDLNAIFNEDTSKLERQSDTFKDLVERLKDVNVGSKEHKNIISQLNNQYGEYLGFIVDEKTTYDQLYASINGVNTALTQKARLASYDKALSRLYEDTEKDISDSMSKIEERFKSGFFRASGPKIIPTAEEIKDIFALIQKEVSNTGKKIGDGLDLGSILSEYYGENVIFSATEQHKHLLKYSESILKQKREEENIQNRINNLYDTGLYSTKEYRDEMEKLKSSKEEELSNTTSRSEREKIEYKYKVEEVRLQGRYEGLDDSAIQKRVDQIQKVSATVADINRRMGEEADKFGQDAIDRVYITFQDASQGVDAIAEQTAAAYKSMQQEIKDQNALKEAGTIHDQAALDNATLMSKVYYRMLEIMGKTELIKEEGADSKELKRLKEQIRLIRDAAKAYDDMRKLHDEAYADEHVTSEYGAAFEEAGLGNISDYAFGTREDELNNLNKLKDSAAQVKDGMLELSKATAQVGVQVDNANQELTDKKLFDAISDIFSNYEISLEMDKLNIPPDLAKRLFGLDSISLDELRPAILEKFNMSGMKGLSNEQIYESDSFKSMSEARQKELKESLEKEAEMTEKAKVERLKTYSQYLVKEQQERIKLKMEEIRKIAEIEAMNEFNEDEKAVIKENIRRETNEKMAKSYWEDFEKSPMFVNLFDDMELATKQSLNNMKTHLESMRDNMIAAGLPASDLKEILDKINQVEGELEQRNPFKSIGEAFGIGKDAVSYKEFVKAKREEVALEEKLATLKASERDYIGNNETGEIGTIEHTKQILSNEEAFLAILPEGTEEYANQEEMVNNIREALAKLIHDHQKVTGEIQETNEALEETQDKTKQWREQVSNSVGFFKQAQSAIDQIGGALSKTLGQLGMSEDNQAIFDSIQNVASDAMGLGADIGSLILNPLDIEAWVSAISNGIALIGNIVGTGDAIRQKAINAELEKAKQAEKVYNDLVDKYEDLQKAMEKSFTGDQMRANKESLKQNIDAQRKALQDQINALEAANAVALDDKNINKEEQAAIDERDAKIEALKKQQKELIEQKEELQKQFVETLGVSYDYAGVAEQFLDAWLTAFEETGDGMKGLEDSFDDFWKSVLKKQVVYGGASKITEEYLEEINKALGDGIISRDEKRLVEDAEARVKNKLDEFYRWANAEYGLTSLNKDGELSGLQQGIQGITEDQADILAAYWNAVRFDVSAIRQRFDDFMAMQGYGDEVNPVENHLKTISLNTTAMLRLLKDAKGDSEANAIRVKVLNM